MKETVFKKNYVTEDGVVVKLNIEKRVDKAKTKKSPCAVFKYHWKISVNGVVERGAESTEEAARREVDRREKRRVPASISSRVKPDKALEYKKLREEFKERIAKVPEDSEAFLSILSDFAQHKEEMFEPVVTMPFSRFMDHVYRAMYNYHVDVLKTKTGKFNSYLTAVNHLLTYENTHGEINADSFDNSNFNDILSKLPTKGAVDLVIMFTKLAYAFCDNKTKRDYLKKQNEHLVPLFLKMKREDNFSVDSIPTGADLKAIKGSKAKMYARNKKGLLKLIDRAQNTLDEATKEKKKYQEIRKTYPNNYSGSLRKWVDIYKGKDDEETTYSIFKALSDREEVNQKQNFAHAIVCGAKKELDRYKIELEILEKGKRSRSLTEEEVSRLFTLREAVLKKFEPFRGKPRSREGEKIIRDIFYTNTFIWLYLTGLRLGEACATRLHEDILEMDDKTFLSVDPKRGNIGKGHKLRADGTLKTAATIGTPKSIASATSAEDDGTSEYIELDELAINCVGIFNLIMSEERAYLIGKLEKNHSNNLKEYRCANSFSMQIRKYALDIGLGVHGSHGIGRRTGATLADRHSELKGMESPRTIGVSYLRHAKNDGGITCSRHYLDSTNDQARSAIKKAQGKFLSSIKTGEATPSSEDKLDLGSLNKEELEMVSKLISDMRKGK